MWIRKRNRIRLFGTTVCACLAWAMNAAPLGAEMPSFSVTNYYQYGTGDEDYFGTMRDKKYLEEELHFNMSWRDLFLGGRYEFDDPAEFSFDHNELRKYFLEYRAGNLKARAGTISTLFSRGMVLNAYEEKPIGHDSELTGLQVQYETDRSLVNIVGGRLDYEQIPDFEDLIKYDIRGLSLKRSLTGMIDVGASYIYSRASQVVGFYRTKEAFGTNTAEMWAELNTGTFQLHGTVASNALKERKLYSPGGNSVYLGLNWFPGATGVTLEYKNYRFGLVDPSERDDTLRHRRMLAFQNPPSALKEHSWTTLSRRTHQVDFNDEVGFQLDVYHSLQSGTTLNFNGAVAARNYRYTTDKWYRFTRTNDGRSWLPSFSRKHSPFWQLYAETEHYFPGGSSVIGGLSYTYEEVYNYFLPRLREQTRAFIVPLRGVWPLPYSLSVEGTAELQKFKETLHGDKYYSNHFFSIGFGRAPWLTAALSGEYMSKGYDFEDKTLWMNGTVRIRWRSRHVVEVGYGETRGGLVCTNGLCRFIPAFQGWRISMETHI